MSVSVVAISGGIISFVGVIGIGLYGVVKLIDYLKTAWITKEYDFVVFDVLFLCIVVGVVLMKCFS